MLSFLFFQLIHLLAWFHTPECSILHLFCFLAWTWQLCLCLSRSFSSTSGFFIKLSPLVRYQDCGPSIHSSHLRVLDHVSLARHLLWWLCPSLLVTRHIAFQVLPRSTSDKKLWWDISEFRSEREVGCFFLSIQLSICSTPVSPTCCPASPQVHSQVPG